MEDTRTTFQKITTVKMKCAGTITGSLLLIPGILYLIIFILTNSLGIQIYFGILAIFMMRNALVAKHYHRALSIIQDQLKSKTIDDKQALFYAIDYIPYTPAKNMKQAIKVSKWSFRDYFPEPLFHRTVG